MTCRAIYTVRRLTPAEQRLVRETLLEGKQRIFLQQFEDGFPTFRHYGLDMGGWHGGAFQRKNGIYPCQRLDSAHQLLCVLSGRGDLSGL